MKHQSLNGITFLLLSPATLANAAQLFKLPSGNKLALDIQPDASSSSLIDASGNSPPATFAFAAGLEDRRTTFQLVSPNYYPDGDEKCSPPTQDPDGLWPGKGCVCFEPEPNQMSYYNMTDA